MEILVFSKTSFVFVIKQIHFILMKPVHRK